MALPTRYVPLLFLLMWSSGAIFVKLGLQEATVWTFLAVRAVGTLLVLGVICAAVYRRRFVELLAIAPSLALKIMGIGLLLQAAYQSFFFLAIEHALSPGVLSIILGLQPILTPVFAREKIGLRGYALLLLGFVGLGIAVLGAKEMSNISMLGVGFGLASTIAISAGSVLQKKLISHPLTSALYQNLSASVVFVGVLAIVGWHANLNTQFVLSATWMITIVSTGAVLLLFYMLANDAASKVSVLFYLVPVITMTLDYWVFGNKVSVLTLFGALLVVTAIWAYRHFADVQVHAGKKTALVTR